MSVTSGSADPPIRLFGGDFEFESETDDDDQDHDHDDQQKHIDSENDSNDGDSDQNESARIEDSNNEYTGGDGSHRDGGNDGGDEYEKALMEEMDNCDDDTCDNDDCSNAYGDVTKKPATSKNEEKSTKDSDDQLKEVGQRVKERFEQEKKKRSEIKVLDYLPETSSRHTKTIQRKKAPPQPHAQSQPKATVSSSGKRKWLSSSSTTTHRNKLSLTNNTTDWRPDISNIIQPKSNNNQDGHHHHQQHLQPSAWVVLHGLPKTSTPNDVRRFFSGLEPQIICVLLSNNVCMDRILDPSNKHQYPRSSSSSFLIDDSLNHAPPLATARVVVKFESSRVAILATERSGEFLFAPTTAPPSDIATNDAGATGARYIIDVTLLDKISSKVLTRNVAVDVKEISSPPPKNDKSNIDDEIMKQQRHDLQKQNKKMVCYTFDDYVDLVERRLPPQVRESLWTCVEEKYETLSSKYGNNKLRGIFKLDSVIRNSNLRRTDFDKISWGGNRHLDDCEDRNRKAALDLMTLNGYQSLARHHNRIADIIDELTEWMDQKSCCALTSRLTKRAIEFLEGELDRLDNLAYQARTARQLCQKLKV